MLKLQMSIQYIVCIAALTNGVSKFTGIEDLKIKKVIELKKCKKF